VIVTFLSVPAAVNLAERGIAPAEKLRTYEDGWQRLPKDWEHSEMDAYDAL